MKQSAARMTRMDTSAAYSESLAGTLRDVERQYLCFDAHQTLYLIQAGFYIYYNNNIQRKIRHDPEANKLKEFGRGSVQMIQGYYRLLVLLCLVSISTATASTLVSSSDLASIYPPCVAIRSYYLQTPKKKFLTASS